jgi:hypothetical protein
MRIVGSAASGANSSMVPRAGTFGTNQDVPKRCVKIASRSDDRDIRRLGQSGAG